MPESPHATKQSLPLPIFALLEWPYGVGSSIITVVSMYLLTQHGIPIDRAAAIYAIGMLPASLYFLYAPFVDFLVQRRTWLLLACAATAVLSFIAIAMSSSHHLRVLTGLLFAVNAFNMLISAATGGLMAVLLTREQKAQVGAWVQVGNLGGNAIAFGVLVYLSTRISLPLLGVAAMALCLPGLAALLLKEPPRTTTQTPYGEVLRTMGREMKQTFLAWRSLPGMLLLASPIGAGGMITVLTGMSNSYHVSAGQLALIAGLGSAAATVVGSLSALLMPARWNRLIPYGIAALLYAAAALCFGFAPLTPMVFVIGMLAMALTQGLAYGAYTGVILQTMAGPGRFQSSRYTLLNSLGNMPVIYMAWLCGKVAARWNPHAVGYFDGAMNLAAGVIFFAWWALRKPAQALELDTMPLTPAEG